MFPFFVVFDGMRNYSRAKYFHGKVFCSNKHRWQELTVNRSLFGVSDRSSAAWTLFKCIINFHLLMSWNWVKKKFALSEKWSATGRFTLTAKAKQGDKSYFCFIFHLNWTLIRLSQHCYGRFGWEKCSCPLLRLVPLRQQPQAYPH